MTMLNDSLTMSIAHVALISYIGFNIGIETKYDKAKFSIDNNTSFERINQNESGKNSYFFYQVALLMI